ncbi:MAG: archaetidylserine decarboxylase [Wenzhouxiangellaceae bacterium]|nr:archaetidylserine decarboxylase [Wenzhouxiangellaceae bacterium]
MSKHKSISRWQRIKVWPQHLLPQHALTRAANIISNSRFLARPFIDAFTRMYPVKVEEAEYPLEAYISFDQFFTRSLKPGLRRFPTDPCIITSPCDGTLSQAGRIDQGRIVQAKGRDFSVAELLTLSDWAERFDNGQFATVYLAPHDYHRVHMPVDGELAAEVRVPGRLFSVSTATSQTINRLYARNERLVALFETSRGPVAVVLVAAMLVAGIETCWDESPNWRPNRKIAARHFETPLELPRGVEIGQFHWGSTVIVLTGPNFPRWRSDLQPGSRLQLGQAMSGDRAASHDLQ